MRLTSPRSLYYLALLLLGMLFIVIAADASRGMKRHEALPSWEEAMLAACEGTSPSEHVRCLKGYFTELTLRDSAREALKRAALLQQDGTIDDCHLAAHVIGETAMSQAEDVGQALASCSTSCLSGCSHGVMEEYIAEKGKTAVMPELLHMCADITDANAQRECVHGVGHGMFAHGVLAYHDALVTCTAFPARGEQDACIDGVTMEAADQALERGTDAFYAAIPHLCDAAAKESDPRFLNYCIRNVGEVTMFATGHDVAESEHYCTTLPAPYQEACSRAVYNEARQNRQL